MKFYYFILISLFGCSSLNEAGNCNYQFKGEVCEGAILIKNEGRAVWLLCGRPKIGASFYGNFTEEPVGDCVSVATSFDWSNNFGFLIIGNGEWFSIPLSNLYFSNNSVNENVYISFYCRPLIWQDGQICVNNMFLYYDIERCQREFDVVTIPVFLNSSDKDVNKLEVKDSLIMTNCTGLWIEDMQKRLP